MSLLTRIKAALTRRDSAQISAPVQTARRLDAWTNPQTGLGQLSFDRSLSTDWAGGVNLTRFPQTLRSLHRFNPLARRIVEKPVKLALSKGLHWSFGEGAEDAAQVLSKEMTRLAAYKHLARGRIWSRLYGGGLLVAHTDDLSAPSEPLPETFGRVVALRDVDWQRVAWVERGDEGAMTGEPVLYYITDRASGRATPIHHTRVFRFDGAEIDEESYVENGFVHDSVLTAPYRTMARVGAGGDSLAAQLDNATKGVWKIKGLHEEILNGNSDFIADWIRTVEMTWSTFRGAALDAESESFEWLSRPMKDSVEVYQALMLTLASAVDMPMTELFGQAPGGLSTDDQSGTRKWYAKIDAEERAGALDPCLAWLTDLLSRQRSTPQLGGAEIAWEWPSLWSMSALEVAQERKTVAEADAIYLDRGVLLSGEVARSRFGGARYSPETQLDQEARDKAALEAGTAELTPEQQLQQGRLALEALHTPATSQAVAAVLGWPAPTPAQIEAFWAQRKGGADGGGPSVTRADAESYKPPRAVQAAARRALEVREEKPPSERGMTPVGLARARDLSNGQPVSEETLRRMVAYFERHEVDKDGETWGERGKGWQAWHGWGGDAGWRWARGIVARLEKEEDE